MFRYRPAPSINVDILGSRDKRSLRTRDEGGCGHDDPRHDAPFEASIVVADLLSDKQQSDQSARQTLGTRHFGRKDIENRERFGDRYESQGNPSLGNDEPRQAIWGHLSADYARRSPAYVGDGGVGSSDMVTKLAHIAADASGRAVRKITTNFGQSHASAGGAL